MRPADRRTASPSLAPHRAVAPTRPAFGPLAVLAAGALALAACGDGTTGDAWAGTVTDSAGVRVVTNPDEGLWGGTSPWRLVEEYRVGGLDGGGGEGGEFGMVVGVDVDPDGNVYVADQQAARIQVFGPDGTHLRTIGQPGSGPGEIGQALAGVFVMDGQVLVPDMANLRLSRYAPDGTFDTSTPLDLTRGIPIRWDRAGGKLVAQRRVIGPDAPATPVGDAVVTVTGDAPDTLTVLPAGRSIQMTGGQPRIRLFDSEPVWDAAADGRLLSGQNDAYRIEIRDAAGALRQILVKAFETREVTDGDQARILAAMRRLMTAQGAPPPAVESVLQGMTFADRFPAWAQLLAGPDGTVFVQHIRAMDDISGDESDFNPQDLGADDWDVFDDQGRFLGVLTLPERFTPLLVVDDAFWGVQRDEFDVNSVVRYRLVTG